MTLWLAVSLIFFSFLSPLAGDAARVAGEEKPVVTAPPPATLPPSEEAPPVIQPPPSAPPNGRPLPVSAPPAKQPILDGPAPSFEQPAAMPAIPQEKMILPITPEAGPSPLTRQPPAPAKDSRYITIDFDNVDIQVFVKFISELTGKNFVIDDNVKGKVTIISPRKISVDEAYKVFESVLDVYGFTAVPAGDVIKILPAQEAREKHLETRLPTERTISTEDRIVTQIISLQYANPDDIKKILDPMIAKTSIVLSYPPTGMLVITDSLSNIKKLQEVIAALDAEGVGEQISLIPLQHTDSDEIVKSLTAAFQHQRGGVAAVKIISDSRTNSVIIVASEIEAARVKQLIDLMDKKMPKGGATLHVYRLQNATAEDIAKVLTSLPKAGKDVQKGAEGALSLLSRDVQVAFDKATNALIITAGREDYAVIEDVVKKLDVPRPMVYIEALIMEVNVNKDFKVGVEWSGIKDTGHISGFGDTARTAGFVGFSGTAAGGGGILPGISTVSGTTTAAISSLPVGFSLGILGAGITIGGVAFPSIGAVIQAYQTDTDVSILSTPQILTLDNEEAEISVGENIPFLTRQDSTSTSASYPVNYNQYEYRDVGVSLKITPHISEEGNVRLKIDQQVTKVVSAGTTAEAVLPTTLKRTVKTTVVVKDKETVVIGGLVGDSTNAGTSKVPFFGDIPLFGWLFKTKFTGKEKTNLFIFLTPHVIRSQGDATALTESKKSGEAGEITGGVIRMRDKKPEKGK